MTTVYVVLGGVDFQGIDIDTVQVFLTYDSALTYGKSLVAFDGNYDWYKIVERPQVN
jgi:hypothetical protein